MLPSIMQYQLVYAAICALVVSANAPKYSYNDQAEANYKNCAQQPTTQKVNPSVESDADWTVCSAQYGTILNNTDGHREICKLANMHRVVSYDYLLMSSHLKKWKWNLAGFSKLFRNLSDTAWEDGVTIIRYINKRGLPMDFSATYDEKYDAARETMKSFRENIGPLISLATALTIQKSLMTAVMDLYEKNEDDADITSYLQTHFMPKLRDSIRQLAGHTNDLQAMIAISESPDEERIAGAALNLYLFDLYLGKLYNSSDPLPHTLY